MACILVFASPVGAQDLKREIPAPRPGGCPVQETVTSREADPEERQQAARLVAAGRNAAVLGDHESSRDLLGRAARLDPTSENIAFLLARSLEEMGELDAAAREYCRYLELAPTAPDAREIEDRVSQLVPPTYPGAYTEGAAAWFGIGLDLYDQERRPEAEEAFTAALREVPDWAAAHFNRALIRMEQGRAQEALADLEAYLRLAPEAPDRDAVLGMTGRLRQAPPAYRPSVALAAGLLPGAGHFYTGRPVTGLLVLASAGGAVLFGMNYELLQIQCRSIPVNGVCPPEDVDQEWTERPFLAPAVGVAVAATLIGAWDAYRGAHRRNEAFRLRVGGDSAAGSDFSILPPSIALAGERVVVHWARVRF
jgi:tetratricopeptide (TPR) repeat protein